MAQSCRYVESSVYMVVAGKVVGIDSRKDQADPIDSAPGRHEELFIMDGWNPNSTDVFMDYYK